MKKNKIGLCALALGSLGFIACLSNGETGANNSNLIKKDTTFLVSLKGTENSLGKEKAKEVRDNFINELRNEIGFNFKVTNTFEAINALEIKTNKEFESVLNSLSNVSKVSINQTYRFGDTYSGERNADEIAEGFVPLTNTATGGKSTKEDDKQDAIKNKDNNQSKESMFVPGTNNKGAGSFVAILDSGFFMDHSAFTNLSGEGAAKARFRYSDLDKASGELKAIRSKKLESVTDSYVGILADGSLYYDLKIPFYFDYGGSSENSSNDFDVYSPWSEHGTHVASIAGANGLYNGIAPDAQLALMKVFYESIPTDDTSAGGVYAKDADILEALNDCVVLGVDALNMSLGSDLDDFSNKSTSIDIISKLEDDGCSCNISAGNAGKALFKSMATYKDWATDQVDTGILGSYANSTKANIIASSTNPTQYYESALKIKDKDGKESIIGYSDQVDYSNGSDGITEEKERLLSMIGDNVEIVTAGAADSNGNYYGTDADYTKVTAANPDYYKGKVAICDRGSTSFVDKAKAAEDAGCAGLIVVNNDPTAIEFTFGMSWSSGNGNYDIPNIPVVFVLFRDRDTLLNSLTKGVDKNGKEITIDSNTDKSSLLCMSGPTSLISKTEAENPDKDQLSDFSSDGATSTLGLAPTIATPGSSIRGATLGKANSQGKVDEKNEYSYEYLNGTSMAAPNYTGIVALLVGEKEFANDTERKEYLKSITMRTMSTATQYEYTSTSYGRIKTSKAMTTGENPKEVTIYTPVAEDVKDELSAYSPRKQGAGVVNASKAINSKTYLEGLTVNDDGSFTNVGNNFAKVELKNNELIKNGKISIGFRVHNEDTSAKTYKVSISVMAPQISGYHNHDNELANYVTSDAKYEGAKVQTPYDKALVKDAELGTITVNASEVKDFTNLNTYSISDEAKTYLENFENGTYLEGYVKLTPVGITPTNSNPVLTMPYIGFYKDYGAADATEPFAFEKEESYSLNGETGVGTGKVYGSDLVDYIGNRSYALDFIKQGSNIAFDSFDNFQSNDRRTSVLKNINNLDNFANKPTIKKDKDGTVTIYAGGVSTDVLYVQEFIYRSINSEKVEIKDLAGNVIRSIYVTDNMGGSTNLYKSHISAGYISSKILNHRGYAELPLYTNSGSRIPNGTYKLKFTYNLLYGSTQVKEYNLVIDNAGPNLVYKALFDNNGVKTLRLKFSEIYIPETTKVSVNSGLGNFTLTKVSDGYVVDIPLDDKAFDNGKLFIKVQDASYTYSSFMFNENEIEKGLMISSDSLTPGSTYSYTVNSVKTANENIADEYEINATDYTGKKLDLKEYTTVITYDKKINNGVKVYGINDKGARVLIKDVTLLDSTTIKIVTTFTKFQIIDNGTVNQGFNTEDNASVKLPTKVAGGKVYVDKASGRSGDTATIYAVANAGYKVESVKVNGVEIVADENGNYAFILQAGENAVEVTFIKA